MKSHDLPASPGAIRGRYLIPFAFIALLAALFASGLAQHAHAAGDSTVRVDTLGQDGWVFVDDNGNGYQAGEFVAGPATPPLGDGSARLATANTGEGVILQTTAYAGTALSDISSLAYSTYGNSFDTSIGAAIYLGLDVDFDTNDGYTDWQGRLNFTPALLGLSDGWSNWDPFNSTIAAWSMSGTPYVGDNPVTDPNLLCSLTSPCTWAEIVANYPDAAIDSGDIEGGIEFKAGGNLPGWAGFDGNVDAFTIGVNGANTTYNFDLPPTCTTCYVATTGSDATGDGTQTNPFRTIQRGVDVVGYNAPDGSGTVIVAAGTYNESVEVYYPMTLQGAGAGQDARTYNGPRTVINAQGAGEYGDGIDVYLYDDDAVTIDGFWFEGNYSAIYLDSDSSDSQIINNTFFNNSQGVYISDDQEYLLVQHNVFYWNRNITYDDPGYGIYVVGYVYNSLIDSNTFTGNNAAAIAFIDGEGEDTTISNNKSTGNGSFAILNDFWSDGEGQCGEEYDDDTLICYNTVLQTGGDAIVLGDDAEDFDIAGNTISRGNGAAIAFTDEDAGEIEIYDNLLSANQYGINLLEGGGVGIYGNQIVSNRTAGINVGTDFYTGGEGGDLEVNYNSFVSNHAGLVNQGGAENGFDATCNWWNSQNGPRIASNPGAWGDTIVGLDREDYQPWLTSSDLYSDCDDTGPEVTITAPTDTNYAIRQRVTPAFTCTDADSGIASCKAYVNTGSSYDAGTAKAGYYFSTNTAGTFTYTVIAIDHAGNTSQESVTYTVGAPV